MLLINLEYKISSDCASRGLGINRTGGIYTLKKKVTQCRWPPGSDGRLSLLLVTGSLVPFKLAATSSPSAQYGQQMDRPITLQGLPPISVSSIQDVVREINVKGWGKRPLRSTKVSFPKRYHIIPPVLHLKETSHSTCLHTYKYNVWLLLTDKQWGTR